LPKRRHVAARIYNVAMPVNPYQSASEDEAMAAESRVRTFSRMGWGCAILLLLLLPLVATIAFFWGGIVGQTQLYHSRAQQQARQMQAFIDQHPDRYADLTIEEASNGWSHFSGTVPSQEDLDALRAEMQRLFGAELGDDMVRTVDVAPEAAPVDPVP
jgi:hypothetical protein